MNADLFYGDFMLNLLVGTVIQAVDNNYFIVIPIIMTIYILINIKQVLSFFHDLKRSKIKKITEALGSNYLTQNTREFIQKELENEYFKLVTGIYIEKPFREELLKIHTESNGNISFWKIKQAFKYIFFFDSKVEIKITRCDELEKWFHFLFFLGLLISTIFFCSIPLITEDKFTFIQVVLIILFGILSFTCSLWALMQASRLTIAKNIQKILNKQPAD